LTAASASARRLGSVQKGLTSAPPLPILPEMEERELTPSQARAVAIIRARHPRASLTFHERPWGFILELREPARSGRVRTIALARFEADGAMVPDQRLPLAA
jgi:hypothetical protein